MVQRKTFAGQEERHGERTCRHGVGGQGRVT